MAVHNRVTHLTIDEGNATQRLDNFLMAKLKGVPKSHIYRIIRKGEVRVNKKRARVHSRLAMGDVVRIPPVSVSEPKTVVIKSETLAFVKAAIVDESDDWLILNKPNGLAVHGGSGLHYGVIEILRELYGNPNLELVHRLDRDTSGCLLVAKKRSFLKKAHELFRLKQVKKQYLALLGGRWEGPKQRLVREPLLKNVLSNGERHVVVSDEGKPSQTVFTLLKNFENCCLVAAYPKTGRTHQIRVHAEEIGHAIIGDKKYGHKIPAYLAQQIHHKRLFLHAKNLSFQLDKPYFHEVLPDETWQSVIDGLKED